MNFFSSGEKMKNPTPEFQKMVFLFFKENEPRNNLNPRLPPRHPSEKIFRENLFLPDSLPQQ